jgi:hypothetical protein
MWFTALTDFLHRHSELLFCSFAIFILILHFYGKSRELIPLTALLSVVAASMFVVLYFAPEPIAFSLIVATLFLYGAVLFVWVSDALLGRL